MKKELDDILYLAGQQATLEELENMQAAVQQNISGRHEFSKQYQDKKQALLDIIGAEQNAEKGQTMQASGNINKRGKKYGSLHNTSMTAKKSAKHSMKKWQRAAAAVAMVAVVGFGSMGAYAAYQKYLSQNNSENNIGLVSLATESGDLDRTQDVEVAGISVQANYIPEGYAAWEETDHCVKYSPSGSYAGNGFGIYWNLFDSVKMYYMANCEETEIQGFKTTIMQKDVNASQDMQDVTEIFMIDQENGSTIRIIGDANISVDELKKVAENLNITYTGSNEKLYDAQMAEADKKASEAVTLSKDVPDSLINTDGHFKWFEYDTAQATDVQVGLMDIENISITDDISGLSQEKFFDYQDDIASYINEEGTLKMAARTWDVVDSDGIHKESSGDVALKCVRVKCKVTNTSDTTQEFATNALGLRMLYKDAQGALQYDITGEMNGYEGDNIFVTLDGLPDYFDKAQYISSEDRHQYFFIDVAPGETIEYTLAYLVYEDCLNQMYLEYNTAGGDYLVEANKEALHENRGVAFIKVENFENE